MNWKANNHVLIGRSTDQADITFSKQLQVNHAHDFHIQEQQALNNFMKTGKLKTSPRLSKWQKCNIKASRLDSTVPRPTPLLTRIVPVHPPLVEITNKVHDKFNGGIMSTEMSPHLVNSPLQSINFSHQWTNLLSQRMQLAVHLLIVDSLALKNPT